MPRGAAGFLVPLVFAHLWGSALLLSALSSLGWRGGVVFPDAAEALFLRLWAAVRLGPPAKGWFAHQVHNEPPGILKKLRELRLAA